jgi:dTDP-glucose pyrophosphorylase
MNESVNNLLIETNSTISSALKKMDEIRRKLLIVTVENKFISLISIGDIQRAIISGLDLNSNILKIIRHDNIVAKRNNTIEEIKALMISIRAEFMPIIDDEGNLYDVIFWENVFSIKKQIKTDNLKLPVVIMAGGKGTRLRPLTNIIPKPLIPIGDKTIIEEIMDRFVNVGCNSFHLSVNFKAETIRHYFEQLKNGNYRINYFQEEQPLGTAGSLFLIKDKIKTTFFVTNCDIIIDEDYSEILKYHRESMNDLTIVSALKNYPIAYGTIETIKGGILSKLLEKPELTFQVNTGFYILEPHLFDEIPENEFFHITTLIETINERKGRVGVFPVSEGSWKDIGTWDEYLKIIK